jgi:monoamine oxidase
LKYGNSPFRLHGPTLTSDQTQKLTEEMDQQFNLPTNLAARIVAPVEPWTNHIARVLDAIPLSGWIGKVKCLKCCKHAMEVMFAAVNGIPVAEQSLLAMLAMVKGGGSDRYWTDTELFRCEGGVFGFWVRCTTHACCLHSWSLFLHEYARFG